MTLSKAFDCYIQDVVVFRNLSAKTEESYLYAKKSLIKSIGDIDLESLTFNHIRVWKQKSQSLTPNTARGYLCCLRQVLKHARVLGINCISPNQIPVPKRSEVPVDYYTSKEITQIIRSIRPKQGCTKQNLIRNKLIVSLLYSTGLRVKELCNLNIRDVAEPTIPVIGKNNKPRLCFVDSRSRQLIDEYLKIRQDQQPYLFIGSGGKRLTTSDVRHFFYRLRSETVYKSIHPHAIRHSYATNLLQNGCHIYTLKELMGHSSISSTAIYLHVKNPELQEAYSKFHSC